MRSSRESEVEMHISNCDILVLHKRTSAQSVYSRIRLHVFMFRPPQFRYQMLCPLWDPIVFTCGLLIS